MGEGDFNSHQIKVVIRPIKVRKPAMIVRENHPNSAPFDKVRRNTRSVEEDKVAPSQSKLLSP